MEINKLDTLTSQQRNPITISLLKEILNKLNAKQSLIEKNAFLLSLAQSQEFIKKTPFISNFLATATTEESFLILSILAIGQGPIVFNIHNSEKDSHELLLQMLHQLTSLQNFYVSIGGIIGYHLKFLEMLEEKPFTIANQPGKIQYHNPPGYHFKEDSPELRQALRWGIESLPLFAEFYPVGGAGDRLNLTDEMGTPWPAALLPFIGKTLLEGLLRDLTAKEYLYFKLFGKQISIPIALMTSSEQQKIEHILELCRDKKWFGKPKSSFLFFKQPVVPVITTEGNWSLSAPLTLCLKPGGHGVIWKAAEENGIFDWLSSQNKPYALIRQINNPLAGTDQSIIAFMGVGSFENRNFGFLSCERQPFSSEGIDVLIERKTHQGYSYCLTNIEYTNFFKQEKNDSSFSKFPSNTNILFCNLKAIEKALSICSIPGLLINLKNQVPFLNEEGIHSEISGGRLESTMQNIADVMIDEFPNKLTDDECKEQLQTFIVYSPREKIISTTKKFYKPNNSLDGTPEQAFYDLLKTHLALLKNDCGFEMEDFNNLEDFLMNGPRYTFLYHPALGPLYSIIAQKVQGGRLAPGSELQLDLAEVHIENLDIEGSLVIEGLSPLGYQDPYGVQKYGNECRCLLDQVKVRNQGIDRSIKQEYWKNQPIRSEMARIVLHEGAELEAREVTLKGDLFFEVPAFHKLTLQQGKGDRLITTLEKMSRPTWHWQYEFDHENRIKLTKVQE